MPRAGRWVLDWAHIGLMLRHLDQALSPLVFARVLPSGPRFDLWDTCFRRRSYVWTGQNRRWRRTGKELYNWIEGQDPSDGDYRDTATRLARSKLSNLLSYLQANHQLLIDYRRWQKHGRRISTGFVESTINRLIGRCMCKDPQMRWSREGAHGLLQVRAAVLNGELDSRARRRHPWVGTRRISWPWMVSSSRPF